MKKMYDIGNSFPFDFEPNGIQFGSKSEGKLSPQSYSIKLEKKWNIFFRVHTIEDFFFGKTTRKPSH